MLFPGIQNLHFELLTPHVAQYVGMVYSWTLGVVTQRHAPKFLYTHYPRFFCYNYESCENYCFWCTIGMWDDTEIQDQSRTKGEVNKDDLEDENSFFDDRHLTNNNSNA